MKLRIEEIRYKNIREFGDLTIDLTHSGGNNTHHVSLIQMPNGTGKTTTMGLIRNLITKADLDEQQVREYAPKIDAKDGEFVMGLATDDQRFRLYMQLDYDLGTVSYRHSYTKREGGGINNGHYLPPELNDTLTESFVDLFVFNGELTDSFIQTDESKAEEAIKIVNRLDKVEAQRDAIDRIVQKRQNNSDGAETVQGLKQNKTTLQKRELQLERLQKERSQMKDEIKGLRQEVKKLKQEREEIIAEDKETLERYQELEDEIDQYQTEINQLSDEILTAIRRPAQLSPRFKKDFEELLEHMTVLQLPKSTSEEFFNELAQDDSCICGRKIDEKHQKAIEKNAEMYLSDEDIGVLNTLKEQLRNAPASVDFERKFDRLDEVRSELKYSEMEQDGLNLDDPELENKKQKLTENIESKRSEIEEKKEMLELLTTEDKGLKQRYGLSWKDNIPEAKREVKKYTQKVQKATGTVEFGEQAEKMKDILDEFIDESIHEMKSKQITKTNQRLKNILGLSEVQIESINESIQIKNRGGISEGQSLSVAYAYLSTLFEGSAVDMPFIIDSPAVSLDHKVRSEVASRITGLFDQLIAFVISTEKEGFVENLSPKINNDTEDIQYFTIYKTETPGIVEKHTNKQKFMNFTSEEEEIEGSPGL
jgi:DNA repair exonuclease SbcCD ATPase subunit